MLQGTLLLIRNSSKIEAPAPRQPLGEPLYVCGQSLQMLCHLLKQKKKRREERKLHQNCRCVTCTSESTLYSKQLLAVLLVWVQCCARRWLSLACLHTWQRCVWKVWASKSLVVPPPHTHTHIYVMPTVSNGCLIWAQFSPLHPETSGLGRPPQMHWIIQRAQKTIYRLGDLFIYLFLISAALTTHTALLIRIVPNRAGFPHVRLWRSPSLWWRPCVHLKLARKTRRMSYNWGGGVSACEMMAFFLF